MGAKKNFVLDTNVILHDYKCIQNFEENDIYIPIVVLEELDHFKKGNEQINFNAREFASELDLIANEKLFRKGVELGRGKGKLYILTGGEYPDIISKSLSKKHPTTAFWHQLIRFANRVKNKELFWLPKT